MKVLILFVLTASMLFAQETRRETVNASHNPADDTKANSDNVPDVYAITGHFDRIVVLRFKYQTDLLAGMERMVKQEKIRNGVILSAVAVAATASISNTHTCARWAARAVAMALPIPLAPPVTTAVLPCKLNSSKLHS